MDNVVVQYVSGFQQMAAIQHAHLSVKVTALLAKGEPHLKVEGLKVKGKDEMSTILSLISPEDIGSFVKVKGPQSKCSVYV